MVIVGDFTISKYNTDMSVWLRNPSQCLEFLRRKPRAVSIKGQAIDLQISTMLKGINLSRDMFVSSDRV